MRIKKILIFLTPLLLILFFWSNALLHLSSRIFDWMDGTFMIWTIQNNISHFTSLAISKIYETNAMYPFPYSLSMTDHFYFPSFIATLISFFSSNYFLQFNLLTVGNHILLYLSFFLLSGRFTKSIWARTIAAFYFSFGPYFFLQIGHLQMVFLWPLILSLYYLFDDQKRVKSSVISGIWMGLQFLTGTYLGVMGLVVITLYFFVLLLSGQNRVEVLKKLSIFFMCFLLVSGISIYGYFLVNATYHPVRDQGQYVSYAAHITDYLFPINKSFIYTFLSSFISLNKHTSTERGAFIGILPIIAGVWLILSLIKRSLVFSRKEDVKDRKIIVWLLLLVIIGFIFSLGPRFNWNGEYKVFPLPYLVLLKLFPPIGIIRATARWYVLIHIAVSIGIIISLTRIELMFSKEKRKWIMIIFLIYALLEFYQSPVNTTLRDYKRPSDLFLSKQCKIDNGPIFEYPFEYRAEDKTIEKYLATKTNALMYSTLHTCSTLSGFSSYEPPLFKKWQADFDMNGINDFNIKILQDNKFIYIRVNLKAITYREKQNSALYIHTKKLNKIYEDKEMVVYKINYK